MVMYRYVKSVPKPVRRRRKIVPYMFMVLGIGILIWTIWPIVSFMITDQVVLAQVISPVINEQSRGKNLPQVLSGSSDELIDANAWYPTRPQKKVVSPVNSYTISIPKFKLNDALVIIAGDDLNDSLIHYGGTAYPGEYGNAVIFGHSTLPQFYKGASDYHAIFSLLPTLKIDDDVFVTYDGVTYRYRVYDKVVVEPNDLSPLEQHFDNSYITLVTCVPPGTLLYRLNVKAKLVSNEGV